MFDLVFFDNWPNFASIEIGKNVRSIGDRAFVSCCNLASIVIPDNVTEMGTSVFWGTMTIYCEVAQKPVGWNEKWYSSQGTGVDGETIIPIWDCNNNRADETGNVFYIEAYGLRYELWYYAEKAVLLDQPFINHELIIVNSISYNGKTYTLTSIDQSKFKWDDTVAPLIKYFLKEQRRSGKTLIFMVMDSARNILISLRMQKFIITLKMRQTFPVMARIIGTLQMII